MNSKLITASGEISSSPVLGRRLRGKVAKEVYCCGKSVVLTGSVSNLITIFVSTIPAELFKEIVYTTLKQVGDTTINYIFI